MGLQRHRLRRKSHYQNIRSPYERGTLALLNKPFYLSPLFERDISFRKKGGVPTICLFHDPSSLFLFGDLYHIQSHNWGGHSQDNRSCHKGNPYRCSRRTLNMREVSGEDMSEVLPEEHIRQIRIYTVASLGLLWGIYNLCRCRMVLFHLHLALYI